MTNLHIIRDGECKPGIQIRALSVPGGLLIITDTYEESGKGVVIALATTFVPMSDDQVVAFLKGVEA